MRAKTFLFYLPAVLLGGCLPLVSLHPLYTEKNIVFKEELLGVWADPNSPEGAWEFKRDTESENAYKLALTLDTGDGLKGLFDAHLLKLKDQLYLDIYPAEEGFEQTMKGIEKAAKDPNNAVWALNLFFTVPVHTFLKIDSIEPQLAIRLTDDERMKKLLAENPDAVEHFVLDESRFLLTAPTKKLQAFVLKYSDGDKLFDKPGILKRTKVSMAEKTPENKTGR
ncbi:MAG: hypothetical protein JW720_05850 [Sedimentisphaerales bacterium]|nr:hypothetical protein [Sedimentisphaerales bacterium]